MLSKPPTPPHVRWRVNISNGQSQILSYNSKQKYSFSKTKNVHFQKPSNCPLGFLSNCIVASYNRTEKSNELDFWLSNFLTVKCLNFRTVSPCEGVKGTHERKNFKQVENSSGAFKIWFFWFVFSV